MDRARAWAEYNAPPTVERQLLEYFLKRLGISATEFDHVMKESPRNWSDYPTYKRRFERLRPLFALLAKTDLVPMSFYLKYCFPTTVPE
jgi:hypothetical protein